MHFPHFARAGRTLLDPTIRRHRPMNAALPRIALLLLVLPLAAGAQARHTHASTPLADSLLTAALESAAKGDTNTAIKTLDHANKLFKKDPEVLYWRGLMLARSTFLRIGDMPRNVVAWNLLEKAQSLDPKNPRYLMEMGRIRLMTPLLRLDAERLFRKAMAVAEESGDPGQIADIAYELGQVKHRRYATAKDRYLITSPGQLFNPGDAVTQKHYTKEFLTQMAQPIEDVGSVDRSEAEERYRRGLRAVPTHENNAVGLLSLLYDQKRYAEMREVVRPFLEARTGSARLRLAAGLAAYRTGDLAGADSLFEDGLSRLTTAERNDAISLSRIIRRRDAQTYDALSSADRMQTDSAFWESADPLLSTNENEAKLEFLSRVAIADLRFSDADMRQVGWRTDRGLIILRYGEPPVVATFSPRFEADAADATGQIITVWFWPKEERTYVFAGPPAMNYATFAGPMRGFSEEMRQDAPFLLDNVPLAAGLDTVPMQVARFRGENDKTATLVIAASVNTKDLYSAVELDRSKMALSLRDGPPSRLKLSSIDTVSVTLPTNAALKKVWTRTVPVGARHRVRVEAQDVAVLGAAARAQDELDVPNPAVGAFEVSDLMIVERRDAPERPLTGLKDAGVVPRGDLSLSQREVFSVYWENYGLRPDKEGRGRFDVKLLVTLEEIDRGDRQGFTKFLGNVADAVGLTKEGEQQLGLRYSREEPLGNRDRVPQITSIGLGTSPPGRYRLELTVTDKESGSVARTERTFYLKAK